MYAARLGVSCLSKTGLSSRLPKQVVQTSQRYAGNSGRSTLRRAVNVGKTSAEKTQARVESAFSLGQGVAAGGAVMGLGALCYYGLGLGKEAGAIDRAAFWPAVVKQRIATTYSYFGASLAFTAASAVGVSRTPAIMNLVARGGWMPLIASIAAMWGTGMLCMSMPYQEGFGAKQLAWMAHSAVVGAVIAPLTMLGGPLLLRAACYTAGMVGGLSTVAICAPSEKFLNWGGPLAMGFGVVFMASIGSMFLPPTTAVGAGMYSVAVYGGLVLFGMFLLYDTQKIIKRAEMTPVNSPRAYDPINNAVSIYVDTINIFVRMVSILAGQRKK